MRDMRMRGRLTTCLLHFRGHQETFQHNKRPCACDFQERRSLLALPDMCAVCTRAASKSKCTTQMASRTCTCCLSRYSFPVVGHKLNPNLVHIKLCGTYFSWDRWCCLANVTTKIRIDFCRRRSSPSYENTILRYDILNALHVPFWILSEEIL